MALLLSERRLGLILGLWPGRCRRRGRLSSGGRWCSGRFGRRVLEGLEERVRLRAGLWAVLI